MEWNGMEWNRMEWNRMEWNRMEWNRMKNNIYYSQIILSIQFVHFFPLLKTATPFLKTPTSSPTSSLTQA
jgi:hypothetical protein